MIEHGKNGLLATTEGEWFSCLDHLVRDCDLRRRFGASGRRTVEREYSLQMWAPRVAELFARIAAGDQVAECAAV